MTHKLIRSTGHVFKYFKAKLSANRAQLLRVQQWKNSSKRHEPQKNDDFLKDSFTLVATVSEAKLK